jgi:hypothetical protein
VHTCNPTTWEAEAGDSECEKSCAIQLDSIAKKKIANDLGSEKLS